ncbi:MAG: c-type cytochrome [Steroidobacteraceae bacterium]
MLRRRAPAAAALAATLLAASAWAGPQQDYMLYCMGCHGDQAQGVAGKVPPLAGSLTLFMRSAAGRDYLLRVPGAANSALTDAQLTAVLNWLVESFPPAAAAGPRPEPFTVAEVARVRRSPLANVLETRRAVVSALAASGPSPPDKY